MQSEFSEDDPRRAEAGRGDRRDQIISEAIMLFNEHGFTDTRLEDIGERLGTAKTSISYHFNSKEGLLLEAYNRALDFSEAALTTAGDSATGRQAILDWLRSHARAHADAFRGLGRPLAIIEDLHAVAGEDMRQLAERYASLISESRRHLERGWADGSVGAVSADTALSYLLNLLHWLPRWLAEIRPADYDLAIDALTDLLAHGLAADRARDPAKPINRTENDSDGAIFNREARNRMKRDAFLRTGTRALNARGYRSLSLNDIASELGVTRGAFYYHIADKDALLQGCFERSCTLVETAQSLACKPDFNGLDQLERCLRWMFDRQASNLDPLIRLNLLSALPQRARVMIAARLNRVKSEFANMIATGIVDGSIRPIELAAAEQLVMGILFSSVSGSFSSRTRESDQAHISPGAYLALLIHGLAGPE